MPEPESPWKDVLPLVIDTAANSAEASAAAAAAVTALEARMTSLEAGITDCSQKLSVLVALEEESKKRETERGAWLRTIVTPQFLIYLITLVLAIAGFRFSLDPIVAPDTTQQTEGRP
tara:strand:- start:2039 stop:2392 length:354 start_codon:yes stop_codon:yes gene_type:complete